MKFDFDIFCESPKSILTIEVYGTIVTKRFKHMVDELVNHPSWTPGIKLLANLFNSTAAYMSAKEVIHCAETSKQYFSDRWPDKIAIAMDKNDSLSYGNATLWNVITSARSPSSIRIFTSLSDAKAWLNLP